MKFKSLSLAAAAVAILGLLPSPATAQQVQTSASNGDLFIGFRAIGGTGATSNYLIKIGPASQFRDAAAGSTINLSLGNIHLDLANIYGNDWSTRSDLMWSVSGGNTSLSPANGDPRKTLYYSNYAGGPAWETNGFASLLDASNDMASQRNRYFNAQAGGPVLSTSNSTVATIQDSSTGNSYGFFQVGGNVTSAYSTFSGGGENDFGDGVAGAGLDLYRLVADTSGPGQLLGTFSISQGGLVTFTAVPEPSTLALFAIAICGFTVVTVRRWNASRKCDA